ncbi:unnamed protein product, partial [Coccothraustes coccothraustes]
VTYRVVQVSEAPLDGPEGAAVSVVDLGVSGGSGGVPGGFQGGSGWFQVGSRWDLESQVGPQVGVVPPAPPRWVRAPPLPQVLQNPFSNGGGGGSPGSEGGAEARLTWAGEGALLQADPALAQAGGQFYVMMTPPDVLQAGEGPARPRPPRPRLLAEAGGAAGAAGRATASAAQRGGAAAPGQDQQLDRAALQDHPRLRRRRRQIRREQGRHPVQGLRITCGSCARATSACRKPSKRPSACRWTTTYCDSRWRSSRARTPCSGRSCSSGAWTGPP